MTDWTVRAGFGPQLETYAPGHFAHGGLVASDARFVSRPCMDYYRFWDRGWVRWIDEPTNEVFIEALKKHDYAIGVNVFHPKIVLGNDEEGPANHAAHTNQGLVDLDERFQLLQLTRNFLAPSLYFDKIFTLGAGFEYRAGIGVGAYVGYARSETVAHGGVDEQLAVIGGFASLRQGLIYTVGPISLGVQFDLTKGFLDFPLLGDRAQAEVSAFKAGLHVGWQY